MKSGSTRSCIARRARRWKPTQHRSTPADASDITEDGCLGDAGASAIEGAFGYAIATMRDQVNTLGLTLDASNEQFGLAPDWLA